MKKFAFYLILLFIVTVGALRAWFERSYNWDLLPYLSHVLMLEHQSDADIRERVQKTIKTNFSTRDQKDLIVGDAYRTSYFVSPESYSIQQKFYSYRKVYLYSLFGIHQLQMPLHLVPYGLNVGAFLLIALMLASLLYQTNNRRLFLLEMFAILCVLLPLTHIFVVATPDALSTLFGLAYLESQLRKRSLVWSGVLLLGLLLTRLDMILLPAFGVIFAVLFDRQREAIVRSFVLLALGTVVYGIVSAYVSETSWSQVFYHTFIEKMTTAEHLSRHPSASEYLWTLYKGSGKFLEKFAVIGLMCAGSLFFSRKLAEKGLIEKSLLLRIKEFSFLSLTLAFAHFFLFPDPHLRFRTIPLICSTLCVCWILNEALRVKARSSFGSRGTQEFYK